MIVDELDATDRGEGGFGSTDVLISETPETITNTDGTTPTTTRDNLATKAQNGQNVAKLSHASVPRIGIDVGGVINRFDPNGTKGDEWTNDATVCHKDVISSIKAIVNHFGANNTFIISKCGKEMQRKHNIGYIRH